MSSFVISSGGGIVNVKGNAGTSINDMATAERGKPGRDMIVNPVNQVTTGTNISMPVSNCDPQSQLQRQQQRIQQQIQQKVEQQITQNIQQGITQNTSMQNLQQQMQSLQQQSSQGQSTSNTQQQEIVNKEMQQEMQKIIAGAVARAAQQMPQATKVANSVVSGLKPIAAVAESAAAFVPSQGINMKNYGSTVKTVQTVSQACFV